MSAGWGREGRFISYGDGSGARLFVMKPFDGNPASVGGNVHVAFLAPDRAAEFDTFHAAALAASGTDEGPPVHPLYHVITAVLTCAIDGNKLQAVCHMAE